MQGARPGDEPDRDRDEEREVAQQEIEDEGAETDLEERVERA